MQWYVVHTLTGNEQKIKKLLEKSIKENHLEDFFGRIVIPVENLVRTRRDGKKVIEERRLYPGYIVIEMEATNETLQLVNTIPGVTHFLGSKIRQMPQRQVKRGKKVTYPDIKAKPISLSEAEVKELLQQVEESKKKVITKIPFSKGDRVTVIDGPFTNFVGTIEDVYPEREKVKVMVVIFRRSTPIELGFHQVKSF